MLPGTHLPIWLSHTIFLGARPGRRRYTLSVTLAAPLGNLAAMLPTSAASTLVAGLAMERSIAAVDLPARGWDSSVGTTISVFSALTAIEGLASASWASASVIVRGLAAPAIEGARCDCASIGVGPSPALAAATCVRDGRADVA